ncbi:MAG: DUF2169 domain-containing protein [Polyangiaceae bacterium]
MFWNATSYAAQAVNWVDERGADVVVILAKATFVRRGTDWVRADEQLPIRMADVPTHPEAVAEGRESSVRYPSDLGGVKSGADVVVVGEAISPRPTRTIDIAVRAPGKKVAIRVHGERCFYKGPLGIKLGPATPFERIPVSYERAYGGASQDGAIVDWRNPAGRGVFKSESELDGAPAPCIEDPARPIEGAEAVTPVSLGAIAMWWSPRKDLGGTMDDAWRATRMPLPPRDFDRRFYQVASPQLQMDRPLQEGDVLAVSAMSEGGLCDVTVPALPLVAHLRRNDGSNVAVRFAIDTAVLEPTEGRVAFTLRQIAPLGRGRTLLREVRLDVD